jgi:integration host factor subunit alpha
MLKKNYIRKNLSNRIYQNIGFSKNLSTKIIDDFFEILILDLLKFNKVKISSFGTFEIVKKRERIGRNPKTKIEAKISARKTVRFKPSLIIKKKLNNNG